jgi:proteasome lid subunit RPN8/RPN11
MLNRLFAVCIKNEAGNDMLKITKNIFDEIVRHGLSEAPLEACGYLAEKDGVVCTCIPMKNIDASPVHYSMDPAQQFEAVRSCRAQGLTLRAVYHSHPETAAYPSAEDIKLAYDPALSYVIVSLADKVPSINSFAIKNDEVFPERVEIIVDIEKNPMRTDIASKHVDITNPR